MTREEQVRQPILSIENRSKRVISTGGGPMVADEAAGAGLYHVWHFPMNIAVGVSKAGLSRRVGQLVARASRGWARPGRDGGTPILLKKTSNGCMVPPMRGIFGEFVRDSGHDMGRRVYVSGGLV